MVATPLSVSSTSDDLTEVERRNVAALQTMLTNFNSRNPAGMLAVFNDDMEWLDVPMEVSYRGHEQVGAFLDDLFQAFPDVTYELTGVVAQGNMLSARFTMHGTHLGNFNGVPPTLRRVDLPCLSLIEMRDGKFVYDHCYFDIATCMRQMGLFPSLAMAQSPLGRASFWIMVKRGKVARAVGGAVAAALVVVGVKKARN